MILGHLNDGRKVVIPFRKEWGRVISVFLEIPV